MSYKMQLLVDYLSGNIGTTDEIKFVSKISHLMIAGNSIYPAGKKDFREFDVRGVRNFKRKNNSFFIFFVEFESNKT